MYKNLDEALDEMVNITAETTTEHRGWYGRMEQSVPKGLLLLWNLDLPLQGALQGGGIFQGVPGVKLGQGTTVSNAFASSHNTEKKSISINMLKYRQIIRRQV